MSLRNSVSSASGTLKRKGRTAVGVVSLVWFSITVLLCCGALQMCRYGDVRTFGEPLFQLVVLWVALSQSEPPAIIMDHDADMIRIVEGRCAALEGGIVEVPFWRSDLPNELRKVVPVFIVAGAAAFGGKIILVPPCELSLWRQRHLASFLAADQIPAHGDQGVAS